MNKIPSGQRSVSAPTSTQQSAPVGKTLKNAAQAALKAIKNFFTGRSSASQHCTQSLSKRGAPADQALWNINSVYQDPKASSVSKLPLPTNRSAAELMGSNPISKPPEKGMNSPSISVQYDSTPETVEMAVLETFNPLGTLNSAPETVEMAVLETFNPLSTLNSAPETIEMAVLETFNPLGTFTQLQTQLTPSPDIKTSS